MLLCTLVGDVVRSSGEARNVRGDETGGLPELSGDAELLESSPPVGLDADARALCSQDLGLLQHEASDPFPGCSVQVSSRLIITFPLACSIMLR